MIIVSVLLISAIDGTRTELARMEICNDAVASTANHRLGDYLGRTFKGRSTAALIRSIANGTVSKRGEVRAWRRHDFHVWNLVRRMLENMGYDK